MYLVHDKQYKLTATGAVPTTEIYCLANPSKLSNCLSSLLIFHIFFQIYIMVESCFNRYDKISKSYLTY